MNRKKLLKHLVILMFFIFLADFAARSLYWYSLVWYFDMIMHFLGGFWEGLFFAWFFSIKDLPTSGWFLHFNIFKLIFGIILFVLLIGILWEFFEFFTKNYIGRESFNMLDTISDVCFDLAGGFFAVFYLFKIIMPANKNEVQ